MLPGLVIGFVVVLGLLFFGDIRQIGNVVLAFDWRYYLIAVLFTLFNYTLRFIKWHYYLRLLGITRLAWMQSLRLFVAGFPLAITPGKSGEVLKALWLQQQSGLPVARGISVVLAERISDGLAVLMLSLLGVASYPQYWPAFASILAILLWVVLMAQIRPLALTLLKWGENLPLIRKLVPALREFYEGTFVLFRPRAALLAVTLGSISWAGEGLGLYFILRGLGFPEDMHTASLAVFILAFSTAVGAASTLPGGLGATEASIAGMLSLVLNTSPAQASAATLLIRLATLWFGVGLGLLVWAFSRSLIGLSNYPRSSNEPSG